MHLFRWFFCVAVMVFVGSLGACDCGPGPNSEKTLSDAGSEGTRGTDKVSHRDGVPVGPDGRPLDKKPAGCGASWTVEMTSKKGNGDLFGVFCPPPTIVGCYSLQTGDACIVADIPTIKFSYNIVTKAYLVEHSGSIEDNSHGKLEAAPDATQPDRLKNLPAKTRIKALFSGLSISFEFDGEKVTVYAPQ